MILDFALRLVLIDIYMKFIENIMNRFQFIVQTRNSVTKFQGKLLKKCKCKSYGSCTLHIVVFVKSYMKIA